MPRKLKTYVASIGFFDLAVAAPSMKAAAEAWGSGDTLFKFGGAKESDDPAVIAATMAKPGVVLRRPVGSSGAFKEHADLPKVLPAGAPPKPDRPEKPTPPPKPAAKPDDAASRKAAAAFAAEQKRRERERRKHEAAQEKERRRRDQAIAKAEAALAQARARHDATTRELATGRAALDKQEAAETTRWEKERETLEAALRRART